MAALRSSGKDSEEKFSPVLNPFTLITEAPLEVIPGHFVQRASTNQIRQIKKLLDSLNLFKGFPVFPAYESKLVTLQTSNGTAGSYEDLAEAEWRYNIVAHTGKTRNFSELELVSAVAEIELVIPLTLFAKGGSSGYPARAAHYLSSVLHTQEYRRVDEVMLNDIRAAYEELQAVKDSYPEISRALQLLHDLKGLPHKSTFEILGLFAIIEMLITHNPKHEDVGDSITHQMKGKLPLLSKRFRKPLDYTSFGGLSEDKIWAKLYQYRSIVAHGGKVDFQRGDLAILKGHTEALSFLRQAVKALVRHSFKEPQLYRDLKEC